jgi:hypothetical protein
LHFVLLGGSRPLGSGVWTLKSGPGAASFSNLNSGSSTAVSLEGIYVFTWTISNGVCPSSTADINEFHVPPLIPTASVTQPTCAVQSGVLVLPRNQS